MYHLERALARDAVLGLLDHDGREGVLEDVRELDEDVHARLFELDVHDRGGRSVEAGASRVPAGCGGEGVGAGAGREVGDASGRGEHEGGGGGARERGRRAEELPQTAHGGMRRVVVTRRASSTQARNLVQTVLASRHPPPGRPQLRNSVDYV